MFCWFVAEIGIEDIVYMNSTADLWHIHCHVTYMALDALNVSSRIIHNNVLHSKL